MQTTEETDPSVQAFMQAIQAGESGNIASSRLITAQTGTDALSVLRKMRHDYFPDYIQGHRLRMLTALCGQAAGMEWTVDGVQISVPPILRDALAFS